LRENEADARGGARAGSAPAAPGAAILRAILAAAFAAAAAGAAPARAADFDYWLLALSWSPSWCATEAEDGAEQCAPERDLGFVLHGLWPQFEDGWPEYCPTDAAPPSRRQTAAMADVMGSGGLAWYGWRKHGTCTGMSAEAYFDLSRFAFAMVAKPDLGRRATAEDVEAAFAAANPGLAPSSIVATCRDGLLREVRLCLSREDLSPRRCGAGVERAACRARGPVALPDAP